MILVKELPEAIILPIAIDNSWKLQAYRRGPVPTGVDIKLRIGTPIRPDEYKSHKALVRDTEKKVQELLENLRA